MTFETKKWEFPVSDLVSVKPGTFKTKFNFNAKIPGLTTKSFFEAILLLLCCVLPFFFYNSKKVNFRNSTSFKNQNEFIKMLEK